MEPELINGDWASWRRFVVESLKAVREAQKENAQALEELRLELAVLKVKAGIWGSLAGVVAAIGAIIINQFLKKI